MFWCWNCLLWVTFYRPTVACWAQQGLAVIIILQYYCCVACLSLDPFHIHTRRGNGSEPCRFRYCAILVMTVSYQYDSRDIVPAGVDVGMTLAWWNMYLSLPYVVPTVVVLMAEKKKKRRFEQQGK